MWMEGEAAGYRSATQGWNVTCGGECHRRCRHKLHLCTRAVRGFVVYKQVVRLQPRWPDVSDTISLRLDSSSVTLAKLHFDLRHTGKRAEETGAGFCCGYKIVNDTSTSFPLWEVGAPHSPPLHQTDCSWPLTCRWTGSIHGCWSLTVQTPLVSDFLASDLGFQL